jgi:short subunit dehydrogenase-like uncharacterized protein
MPADRTYDIVLFGATGFTGGLTADYLAGHLPAGKSWAIAGRNKKKLTAVRKALVKAHPDAPAPELVIADVTKPESLKALAADTRVVVTTVGPYINYGEPLVAACAATGTDYLDLTGEPEFVDLMFVKYHTQATASGARLIHCCGFDSIPHDLGAFYCVQQLPEGVPVTVRGFVRANGTFSGGTYHSAITGMSRGRSLQKVSAERRKMEPRTGDRKVGSVPSKLTRRSDLGGFALPLPLIDPQVVKRSARALERYGPDFKYGHFGIIPGVRPLAMLLGGVSAALVLAQVKPTREWLLGRVEQGTGPSESRRARSWFEVIFEGEGGGQRVTTRVRGGDPGYTETAKMLSEAALCVAFDELPKTSGQVTTAQALGNPLIDRLQAAGITFSQD